MSQNDPFSVNCGAILFVDDLIIISFSFLKIIVILYHLWLSTDVLLLPVHVHDLHGYECVCLFPQILVILLINDSKLRKVGNFKINVKIAHKLKLLEN